MALPEPSFITRDPAAVTAEMIASYEAATGKTLLPAQVERVLIDLIAYRENLLRIGIQEAAKQNLVEYAIYPMIDHLGALVGVTRLEAQAATCTIRFTLTAARESSTVVPSGTRVETKDGILIFTTDDNLVIAAGASYGDAAATCQTAGIAGNGYLANEVNSLVDVVAYIDTAANTTTTDGGSDAEDDDALRARIKLAPERFSNAGSYGAYRYHALSAHPDIIAVAVTSPSAGVVNVYPLTSTGTPTTDMIGLVAAALTDEKVRPLTDNVVVLAPTRKAFAIEIQITLYNWPDSETVQAAVEGALAAYAATQRSELGRDVVTSQIIAAASDVYGVYKVELVSPAADIVNAENEWSDCAEITVTVTGSTNG